MERKEVYKLIDGERDYQNLIVDTDPNRCGQSSEPHSIIARLAMIKVYLDKAMEMWCYTSDDNPEPTTDIVRKIAGISVACMEDHGAPERKYEKV